ncbi:HlyD family secretion protein [Rhodopila globiformis]|uniref:Uncharacterized protein n=1 Tax=Rhodopila globiformis TaxID=1071 RepID=A0A2S6MZY1_RHOGL|nr:HlyD family efflux transporter periplasmic adaptor subunit [Rhodopila globiformis]PPQ27912.1 hypothetical protein CCS01_26205 [Rhodopila globiformis]
MIQQASPPTTGLQEPRPPVQASVVVPPPINGDLVPVPSPPPRRSRRTVLLLLALLAGGLGGGTWWWLRAPPPLPAGIAFSNGRLEADEIDISTKFPGRIAEILAEEADRVTAGQVVARMDVRDLQTSLAQAEAQIAQARHAIAESEAVLAQIGSQVKLAAQELQRARTLVKGDYETRQVLDQRQSQFDAAVATYHGTEARIAMAKAALEGAIRNADLIRVNIADNTLVAPKNGPIQYRLANVGEVLAAGGKVFTMLDAGYVYMDVFLPTAIAGRVKLGDQARILLDALPGQPLPATVTFIASKNQFTPKMVETRSERDKLMFRVRVRVDPKALQILGADLHAGVPGLAYIRFDPHAGWPPFLELADQPPAPRQPTDPQPAPQQQPQPPAAGK